MCKFTVRAHLCGCMDLNCKQRPDDALCQTVCPVLGVLGGHIVKIETYLRTSGLCLGNFTNEDPNRLTVQYGMDPRNGNSKQDCKDKIILLDPDSHHVVAVCKGCKETCDQTNITPPDWPEE